MARPDRTVTPQRTPERVPSGPAGEWVFVAGATGRIGTVTAEAFAREGAHLAVHSRRGGDALDRLAADLRHRHRVPVEPVHCDVTDPEQVAAVRDRLAAAGVDRLAALVNCTTGFGGAPTGAADLPVAEFRRIVDVDLVGSFVLVQTLLPLLARRKGARAVLFSSLAGLRGRTGAAHLCAAKAGVQGLVLALARELAPHGVGVNAVAPGPVAATDGPAPPALPPGVAVSTPQEVADVVLFLASGAGAPVCGQVMVVNGGQP